MNGFNKPENGFSDHETETTGKRGKSEPNGTYWDIGASALLEHFGNLPG